MKTIPQIVTKMDSIGSDLVDLFKNMTSSDFLIYLPFEHAKQFLKKDVTEDQWLENYIPLTKEAVINEMKEYMDHAWDKANNERGISSQRSMAHYDNWLWLIDDHETLLFLRDDSNYEMYGKPILRKICEVYGFKIEEEEE